MISARPGGTAHVLRERYVGVDDVERFLRENYVDVALHGPRDRSVRLEHDGVSAPGFAVSRLVSPVAFEATCTPHRHLVVTTVGRGRVTWTSAIYGTVVAEPGESVLAPTHGEFHTAVEPGDADVVVLDPLRVAEYAVPALGVAGDDVEFTGMTPISACMGGYWQAVVAHVRATVAAEPWAGTRAVVLDQAFRSLSAALLSVFPNTAPTSPTAAGPAA